MLADSRAETRVATVTQVQAPSRLLAGSAALLVVDVRAVDRARVTGTVDVHVGSDREPGALLATGRLDAAGRALLTVTLPLGEHQLRVGYAGDERCAPSAGTRVLKVAAHPTLVTVAGSRRPVPSGETVVLTAQVSSREGSRQPSGTVLFLDGGRELGSAPVDADGAAVLPVDALATGVHRIVAAYSGDPSHAAARSTPIPQAVAVRRTSTRLALRCLTDGGDATIVVTLLDDAGAVRAAATGEVLVTLSPGSPPLRLPLVEGSALVQVPAATVGDVRADYAGDAEHTGSSWPAARP